MPIRPAFQLLPPPLCGPSPLTDTAFRAPSALSADFGSAAGFVSSTVSTSNGSSLTGRLRTRRCIAGKSPPRCRSAQRPAEPTAGRWRPTRRLAGGPQRWGSCARKRGLKYRVGWWSCAAVYHAAWKCRGCGAKSAARWAIDRPQAEEVQDGQTFRQCRRRY
ncbi:Uncharacterised protein [Mycobacteroides abscessus subsp. massiliense]|nr:Uncharacterised protein [Mycobacteroides abscessus subsp. massiliense]